MIKKISLRNFKFVNRAGFGLVELLIAMTITTILLFSVLQFIGMTTRLMRAERFAREATLVLSEGEDAVKFIRDVGWTANIVSKTVGTTYYLQFSGNTWTLTAVNPGLIDGLYARTIVFNTVLRDINGNVVASGGIADDNSRRVTISVVWQGIGGTPQSMSNIFYVNNILRN